MKKGTKLLSVLMAFVMLLSAFAAVMAASAQEVYKPTYTKDITEEDVSLMLGDVNTVLARDLLNGDAIESIYKLLPSLKSLLMHNGSSAYASDKAAFYKDASVATALNSERFAELPDGQIVADVIDENGNIVTKGTFTEFFETHPIVCKDLADFRNELNNIIDTIVVQNILDTIPFAFLMAGSLADGQKLGTGLDEVCAALGVEQNKSASSVLGFNLMLGEQADLDGTKDYLKNIVNTLLPDVSNNLMTVVQRIITDENGAKLYGGVAKILDSLDGVVKGLASTLSSLGIDITEVQNTIANINTAFLALPTLGEGEAQRLNLEGAVSYLVGSLTDNALTIQFVTRAEGNGTAPKKFLAAQAKALISVKFRHMKLDRVANAESTADVAKIIYDYLYDNLIADRTNNNLITMAIETGIVEGVLGAELPKDVKSFILEALKTDREPLADKLIVMLANEVGREIPEDPTEPEKPIEPEKPTDSEKPTEPEKPADTDTPTEPPAQNGGNTVKEPVSIPKTGAAAVGFSALSLMSAAAFVLLAVRSKKEDI